MLFSWEVSDDSLAEKSEYAYTLNTNAYFLNTNTYSKNNNPYTLYNI